MNRKMESTYFIVPDHIAQSSSLSDAAFRLLVWMLCKKNKDRIADFSRFSLQSDKQHSITELINKNYLQQDDTGLYINNAIMYEDFKEQVEVPVSAPDPSLQYFQQVFDLVAEYSQKRLNFNNSKFRVRCDEFMRQGFTIDHIKVLCIQLNSRNPAFDWYELDSTELQHIKDVSAVNRVNAPARIQPVNNPASAARQPFQPTLSRQGVRHIQNQSGFMPSYHQIRQDPQKMADIKQVYDYWFSSKRLQMSQYIAPKQAHFEKLHSLLMLHSITELKRAVDGVDHRRDLVNKGRNFNDIFTNSGNIESLISLADSMEVSQADSPALRIFNYWLERTQTAAGINLRMTAEQRDRLILRLEVFTEADLKLAIDGAQVDLYYQSVNFAFGLLFKDDTSVHSLISLALNGKQDVSKASRKDSNLNKALADMGISKLTVGMTAQNGGQSRPQMNERTVTPAPLQKLPPRFIDPGFTDSDDD
ncbi:hypothetical protein [Moritella viscosa]|uniref:hypothetical protein n=1 Tax=Moritella viscosa TaxID=80854 RepID=UPI0009101654|nr:hypothetical protein [Moritella viscosa]SGY87729.1 Putative uncharacterized protein [Moritella viscosa]